MFPGCGMELTGEGLYGEEGVISSAQVMSVEGPRGEARLVSDT